MTSLASMTNRLSSSARIAKVEEVEEGTINERPKEWKMEDAEIDEWEKVLLSDYDIEL